MTTTRSMGLRRGLGVEKNGSNWRDRYFYKTTGPKIKTETNNSISEMSKAAESQAASSSALVRVDEVDARDEAKEMRQNTKKAAKMLEGLMRLMQAARGLLLQMKASSGQISREIILRLEAAENFWIDFSNKELTSEDFERFCEMCQLHEQDLFSDFPALNPHAPKQLKNIEQEDEEEEEEDDDDDEASRKKKPKSKAKAKAKAKALGKRKRGVYDEEDDGANEDAPKAKELKQGMEVEDDKEMKDKADQEGKKEEPQGNEDNEEEPKDQEGKEEGDKEDEGKEEEPKDQEGKGQGR